MKEIALDLKRLNKTMAELLHLFQNEVLKDNERRIKYELEREKNDNK